MSEDSSRIRLGAADSAREPIKRIRPQLHFTSISFTFPNFTVEAIRDHASCAHFTGQSGCALADL